MKKFIPHFMLYLAGVSEDRRRLRKSAISNVISTVILVSVMLIIAIVVIGFATNVFAIQSDIVEFDQAKNTMINFAGIIEQVSAKQGSAGYVLFNPRTGGPSLLSEVGYITVSYLGTDLTSISGYFNTLKYRGGSLSSVALKSYLRGTEDVVTYNNNSTLGSVYLTQTNSSWIVLDYARIGVMNLGTFNFSKGILFGEQTFETVNLIQINYINITGGIFSGSGSLNIVATCNNINVSYIRFDKTSELDFTIELTEGDSENIKNFKVPDINSNYDIIVIIVRSDVEISMVG